MADPTYTPDPVRTALVPAYDAACDAVKAAGYPWTIEQANALLIGMRAALAALAAAGRLRPITWDREPTP